MSLHRKSLMAGLRSGDAEGPSGAEEDMRSRSLGTMDGVATADGEGQGTKEIDTAPCAGLASEGIKMLELNLRLSQSNMPLSISSSAALTVLRQF